MKNVERWEIIFVVKKNGSLIASARREIVDGKTWSDYYDKIPHPTLSGWEPVKTAGIILPEFDDAWNVIKITVKNKSWHFKPEYETLDSSGIEDILQGKYPNREIELLPF